MATTVVELPKGESIALFANRCIRNMLIGDTVVITFFADRNNRKRAKAYYYNSIYKEWRRFGCQLNISLKISMIEGELSIKRLG